MVKLNNLLQKNLVYLIQVYRYLISPVMGNSCRFHPSCSEYAQLAIKQYGSFIGLWMTVKRLLSCHPWHPGGYDPVRKSLKPPTGMS